MTIQPMRLAALAWIVSGAACEPERPPAYFELPTHGRPVVDSLTTPNLDDAVSAVDTGRAGDTSPSRPDTVSPRDTAPPVIVDEAGPDQVPSFVGLFKALSPSVVNIYTQEVLQRRLLDDRFGLRPEQHGTSLGSGMVLDVDGHILTNAHVVENAAEIRVRFHDDTELPARLLGIDPVRDLALLKVDGAVDLRPVAPGRAADLSVGDWVVAIGNPFGLSHTMTKGIVSGMGRAEFINDRMGYLDLIQTDAPINQGSSGGPLVDMTGRVVGINTAVNAEGHGIAFAIRWEVVDEALPRLMQGGQVSRSWLGVYIVPGDGEGGGVLVDAVVNESPAARAGLKPNDIIASLDGRPVREVAEFRLRIASAVAGREMPVEVLREGRPLRLMARLEEARDIR